MAKIPDKNISVEDFTEETFQLESLRDGEALCKTRFISLDPYLAEMMQSWQGPEPEWREGIIVGRMVGEIIESRDPRLEPGDWVNGDSHWQSLESGPAKRFRKLQIEPGVPMSAYLGVLGASGLTAWIGVNRIIDVKEGETFTVSSAAGTVGAIAGQLAKMRGAKVVGVAGGQDKCREVVSILGFDACVDHLAPDFEAQLAAAVDGCIDAHYENVGTKILDPVLGLMRDKGRIGLCGLIAHYLNDDAIELKNFRKLLTSGLTLQGFRIYDHLDAAKQAQVELMAGIRAGKITVRETITEGLPNAPQAYVNMLGSGGIGKHVVHLTD